MRSTLCGRRLLDGVVKPHAGGSTLWRMRLSLVSWRRAAQLWPRFEKDASVRRAWCSAAVASQTAATEEYHDKFVELVRSLPPRPSGPGRRASA